MDDVTARYLDYLDRLCKVIDAAADKERPAYAETCICGGSVVVGRETSRADLRRIYINFLGRHRACVGLDHATGVGEAS